MADNQYVNRVDWNGGTLIDLTTDDVSRADVALGKVFHLPSGEQTTGTSAGAGGAYNIVSTIDENDKQHLAITDAQGGTTIEPLSATANGTYEESGKAYSPVVVNVPTSISVEPKSITANGTYTAPSGVAYNPITVNVPISFNEYSLYTDNVTQQVSVPLPDIDSSHLLIFAYNVSGYGGQRCLASYNGVSGSGTFIESNGMYCGIYYGCSCFIRNGVLYINEELYFADAMYKIVYW